MLTTFLILAAIVVGAIFLQRQIVPVRDPEAEKNTLLDARREAGRQRGSFTPQSDI